MTSAPVQRSGELLRALAFLGEPPGPGHARVAGAVGLGPAPAEWEHVEVFTLQLHPYASVHLGAEGMLGGEARDRVAGFWRALGRTPPPEPDHLCALLSLYAELLEEEGARTGAEAALTARARRALLHEHLAPWAPFFLERVGEVAGGFYGAWADLAGEALARELWGARPPDGLPLHLREAPVLPDPRHAGSDAFLSGLLAPARSGVILTRSDLAGLARTLGLGARAGARRRVLEDLVAQEPATVLAALGAEAEARGARHAAREPVVGPSAGFWAGRAREAARLLRELAEEGRGALAGAAGEVGGR